MTNKLNIDNSVRGFWFETSGSNSLDGQTVERPKFTAQAAIDAAFALTPIPSAANPAQVTSLEGGNFDEEFVLQDGIQFRAENSSFEGNGPNAATLASFLSCDVASVFSNQANSNCFLIDGQQSLRVNTLSCRPVGNNSVGFNITGNCDDLFIECAQLTLVGDGATGFKITSASPTPIDINLDTVVFEANNNAILFDYDPVNITDTCVVNVSSISVEAVSGITIFQIRNGQFRVIANDVVAETVIRVESGATFHITANKLEGDIIVDSGGELIGDIGCVVGDITNNGIMDITVVVHSGSITNTGTLNGNISGEPFGTYRQKHEEQSVLNASDFTTQTPLGLDMPYQVLFGSAQNGPTDPVELDASGNIAINQTDQYNLRILLEYGRSGAGSFSVLIFRILINGNQMGNSQYSQLSTSQTAFPVEFSGPVDLTQGDVVTIEIIRDGTGFNDGQLIPFTPMLGSVSAAPSAMISIRRNRLIQPI